MKDLPAVDTDRQWVEVDEAQVILWKQFRTWCIAGDDGTDVDRKQ
jgi:hypothetical protein